MSLDTLVNVAIFAVALFLMVRFGCGRHMMGHAQSPAHAAAHGGAGSHTPARNGAIDPVCGMTVEASAAFTATLEGRTYFFCSESCRKEFEASPLSYATKAIAAPPSAGHQHGCC